jgi:hypothetical protein
MRSKSVPSLNISHLLTTSSLQNTKNSPGSETTDTLIGIGSSRPLIRELYEISLTGTVTSGAPAIGLRYSGEKPLSRLKGGGGESVVWDTGFDGQNY